ncbi:MAG: PilN domain-containing protein [bacterium]
MRILLNLNPPVIAQRRGRTSQRRMILGIPVIAAGAIVLVYVLLISVAGRSRAVARETETLLVPLRPAAVRLSQLQAETEELERRRMQLQSVIGRPGTLSILLEDVSRLVPKNVWLQSLAVEGSTVTLSGSTTDLSAIALFATTLARSRVLAGVEMRSIQQGVAGERMVTQFQLSARLK